jgi:hypothetical protein
MGKDMEGSGRVLIELLDTARVRFLMVKAKLSLCLTN